jgi:hypothetical protein
VDYYRSKSVELAGPIYERSTMRCLLIATIFGVAAVGPVFGQGPETLESNPKWQERCRAAAEVVALGPYDPGWRTAVSNLGQCEDTGGRVLAELWRSRPQDVEVLEPLAIASRRLSDQRILDAVLDIAADEGAETVLRLFALGALVSYVHPRYRAQPAEHEPPGYDSADPAFDGYPLALSVSMHGYTRPGARPFPPGHERRILDEVARIRDSTSDPLVARAARHIVRTVRVEGTP